MRIVLKRELKRPKAPKVATEQSLANYLQKLNEVEKKNIEIRNYNRRLSSMAERAQRAVAGFGKGKSAKRGRK